MMSGMVACRWLGLNCVCWWGLFALPCALASSAHGDQGQPPPASQVKKLIKDLKDSDSKVREVAAEALWELGPKAAEAMPALVEVFLKDTDEGVSHMAALALKAIGPAAEPRLIRALASEKAEERARAAFMLGWLDNGNKKGPAVAPLMKLLKDKSSEVRIAAARALGRIADPVAVPVLIEVIKRDRNKFVRAWSVESLRYFHS